MFYLASHISILILYRAYSESRILHLASCIFYLRISRDNWGRVSRASRMLYLTPCILLTSHLTFFLFHSFASFISHLMFFMPHNVTYVYVYDICMTYVIDIFIDTYDTCVIFYMTHMS